MEVHDSVQRALTIPGYTEEEELVLLGMLAQQVPPDTWVVEVGVWRGRSLAALSLARNNHRVAGADHFKGSPEHAKIGIVRAGRLMDDCRANLDGVGAHPLIRIADSVSVAQAWEGEIGLLFLDGGHDHDSVRADLDAWLPHLISGGVLAVHDYVLPSEHPEQGFPGVRRALDACCYGWQFLCPTEAIRIGSLAVVQKP